MFFNSKKKMVTQIAVVIENYLRTGFVFTEHLQDGKFNPPSGFWTDNYIIGFSHQLAALFIKFDFGGDRWSAQKKGEVIIGVFKNLCGDNWLLLLNTVELNVCAENKNQEFERGTNDATTIYLSATGRLKPDDPDPVLAQAKSLMVSMSGDRILSVESSSPSSLAGAVSMLTINKHIKEKYIKIEAENAR